MVAPHSSARGTGGRMLLGVAIAITGLLALGMLLNDLVRVIYLFEAAYDLNVELGSPLGIEAGLPGDSEQSTSYYRTVLISSFAEHAVPRTLHALAIALTSATFLAAALVIIMLCRRLWTGRTFVASTASGLLVLAGLTLVTSWLAPWLRHTADAMALDELGYATSGGAQWAELTYYDPLMLDEPLLVLGTVLLLAGLVYLGARSLQRDTEGLV